MLYTTISIWTIIFNQSQGRPATFAPKKRKKVPLDLTRINREIGISLLAETPLTDTIANFFPKVGPTLPQVKN
jgi:hypothetical protein